MNIEKHLSISKKCLVFINRTKQITPQMLTGMKRSRHHQDTALKGKINIGNRTVLSYCGQMILKCMFTRDAEFDEMSSHQCITNHDYLQQLILDLIKADTYGTVAVSVYNLLV